MIRERPLTHGNHPRTSYGPDFGAKQAKYEDVKSPVVGQCVCKYEGIPPGLGKDTSVKWRDTRGYVPTIPVGRSPGEENDKCIKKLMSLHTDCGQGSLCQKQTTLTQSGAPGRVIGWTNFSH